MSKIITPPKEILDYIENNYYYQEGKIYNLKNEEVGFLHKRFDKKWIYKISVSKRKVMRSHIVWFLTQKYWPTMEIDHKDRNQLNDLYDNLREVTDAEQQQNKNNYKGHKGFSVEERKDKPRIFKWRVRNQTNKVTLGNYDSREKAIEAIDEWIRLRGEEWKWG